MSAKDVIARRLAEVARVLDVPHPQAAGVERLVGALLARHIEPDDQFSYLILAVLGGGIPEPDRIQDFTRRWRVDGLRSLLEGEARSAVRRERLRRSTVEVRVVSGYVADVTDTGRSRFTTGIQRVARETLSRWGAEHDIACVTWTLDGRTLKAASAEETERATLRPARGPVSDAVVIPFRATFILPEIAVDRERAFRLRTIARFSGGRAVAIGFDTIPVSSAETAGRGMPGAFSNYLATLAQFDAVAPISSAAETEYLGWRTMLSAAGLLGPDVREVELPFAAGSVDDATVAEVAEQLALGDEPVVLAVGSHEPRKNHLRLLVAAELRWRAGDDFTLVMVGGNSWDAAAFERMLLRLRARGRRIVTLSNASDEIVWSLYRLARFSVFCSLNEGFGLPVVESLSVGTPVVTSDFGSMRELGEGYGALLVDPRDVEQLSAALGTLLHDDTELERLRVEAESLPPRTWDDYATELWDVVTGAAEPAREPVQR